MWTPRLLICWATRQLILPVSVPRMRIAAERPNASVVAEDVLIANSVYALIPPVNEFVDEVNRSERTEAERIAEEAVKQLRSELDGKSVTVSSAVLTGNPKQAIVRHAEEFGADCIFTGATGFSNPIERFLVGSVSAAVAARAHCSVEVVRGLVAKAN